MITLYGSGQRFCDGMSRRNFLRIGAFGAGLSLADVLRAQETGGARPKSAIMIYLFGGPPHLDMYDMKPAAPVDIRGEFKPISTNVPGVSICELMPLQAKMFDKLAVLRSVVPVDTRHSDCEVTTGYTVDTNNFAHHPSFGSVVSKLRGHLNKDIPPYITLRGMTRRGEPSAIGLDPGFLGLAHGPFMPDEMSVQNLRRVEGVNPARQTDRKRLLGDLDNLRRDVDASGTLAGIDAFTERAFDTITSGAVRRALDLDLEAESSRERYEGVEQFLTARRLVEAGVRCVTVGFGYWDTHQGNFDKMRDQLPKLDRGLTNLIQDLHDRGLDQDVVTVMWGEFGRTPKINNKNGGRDHWPSVMSALVAGGGLKMGQVIGSTNARGEYPTDLRYTPAQVLSTLYGAIGIDPSEMLVNERGLGLPILSDRSPVTELL